MSKEGRLMSETTWHFFGQIVAPARDLRSISQLKRSNSSSQQAMFPRLLPAIKSFQNILDAIESSHKTCFDSTTNREQTMAILHEKVV
ncbi:hypothetical protein Ae201684_003792 [Aphanomyces euteiches]|uniref:Uncharacterized protein n=1 Tax=Aphanomyces euteiches TaxID=100861 RepID=A0A6G0XKH3_9STRA|nr:hypothetical protein Ae201684_003792 [Aphanomyces euteiches]